MMPNGLVHCRVLYIEYNITTTITEAQQCPPRTQSYQRQLVLISTSVNLISES